MKKQSGKAFNPVQPLTDIELRTIKAGWDEWGNQGETGSLGGDLFENNAGTAVVGAGDAGTSPEEDTWSWATLDVPADLNTQSADEGEDEGAAAAQAQADADADAAAAAAQAQADADAAAAAQGQADAGAAAAAQSQADADAAQSQADAAAAAAQAQADADAAADDAAQAQADADAAAAAQAAVDYAARAAASAYDAQVAADAAAQAALLAGDDDGYDDDDDDSDADDGYGGSIFNDYSLLSGSTAASNQSSANGFLAGSSSNSFQVPLTASDVTNLFGSGSGSLISSPVDLGTGTSSDDNSSGTVANTAVPASTVTIVVQTAITKPWIVELGVKSTQTVVVNTNTGQIVTSDATTGTTNFLGIREVTARTLGTTGFSTAVNPIPNSGGFVLNVTGDTGSAFYPFGNIDYNYTIIYDSATKTVSLVGAQDGFPTYTIKLDGAIIYNRQQDSGVFGSKALIGDSDVVITPGQVTAPIPPTTTPPPGP